MLRMSLGSSLNNYQCFKKKHLDIIHVSIHHNQRVADPANVKFLAKLLNIKYSVAVDVLNSYKRLSNFSQKDIAETYSLYVRHGLDKSMLSRHPKLLYSRTSTLEQRINFYKDAGFVDIMPLLTCSINTNVKCTIQKFKEQNLLLPDADVTKNFLNCLHEPPPSVPTLESFPEDHTLGDIHYQVLRHYLSWKLEATEEQVHRMMTYRFRFKHLSFSLLSKLLDVLMQEFQFSTAKIIKCSWLFNKSPSHVREIIEEFRYIGNDKLEDVVIKYPKILILPSKFLREKLQLLEDFKVSKEALSKYPPILTLSKKTLEARLNESLTIKEIKVHWSHPRFLSLIFYINLVKKRIEIIKQLNIRCCSLHLLCSKKQLFERYIMIGSDRTKGKDLIRFLSYELGVEMSNPQLICLKRHPFWCQIPLLHAQESFAFLKEENYSNEDIIENIQIILYRSTHIQRELKRIYSMKLDQSLKLSPSKKLALCLYEMERPYHFDGNGVWNCKENESANQEEQDSQFLRQTSKV